jgi:hypothetical protein
VRVDWRSEPEEILSEFSESPNWIQPTGTASDDSAAAVVTWLAASYRSRGLSLVNLEPGTDGWFLVATPRERVSELQKLATSAGFAKPVVL